MEVRVGFSLTSIPSLRLCFLVSTTMHTSRTCCKGGARQGRALFISVSFSLPNVLFPQLAISPGKGVLYSRFVQKQTLRCWESPIGTPALRVCAFAPQQLSVDQQDVCSFFPCVKVFPEALHSNPLRSKKVKSHGDSQGRTQLHKWEE